MGIFPPIILAYPVLEVFFPLWRFYRSPYKCVWGTSDHISTSVFGESFQSSGESASRVHTEAGGNVANPALARHVSGDLFVRDFKVFNNYRKITEPLDLVLCKV